MSNVLNFKNKNKEKLKKAIETIDNMDSKALEREEIRAFENILGGKAPGNIDISLTEEYDKKVKEEVDEAFDIILENLEKTDSDWLDEV